MFEDLKGKVAIITGSTSGMGKSAAFLFAKHGCKVVVVGRNEEEGKKVAEKIKKNAMFVKCDVSDESCVKKMIDEVIKKFGKIDILYNNAGILLQKPIDLTSAEEFESVIKVNLEGQFLCAKYALAKMKQGASIINTASIAGLVGFPALTAYCASKGGIIALTRQLALDLAKKGIRVNCICPGAIDTPMTKGVTEEQIKQMVPLGRIGKPEEVANLALFLASDASSYITGSIIVIDGGATSL